MNDHANTTPVRHSRVIQSLRGGGRRTPIAQQNDVADSMPALTASQPVLGMRKYTAAGSGRHRRIPWSNSSPRELDEPVRRACLPSMLSKVEYTNKQMPCNANTQDGALPVKSGSNHASMVWDMMIKHRPTKVICG